MLPISDPPLVKPKSPDLSDRKNNSLHSIQSFVTSHPRSWLLISILSLQILLLFVIHSLPVSFSFRHFPPPSNLSVLEDTKVERESSEQKWVERESSDQKRVQREQSDQKRAQREQSDQKRVQRENQNACEYGKVYVYDLPPMFNRELSEKCEELNPWHSRCEAISNDGLGRKANTTAGVVPENLAPAWYWTDQFASEIIFHNRILGHKCRTLDPESATAFYLPFYAGLAVGKYLWSDNYTSHDRDFHSQMLLKWVQDQPYWKRSNGWDHFIMLGRISWDFRRSKDGDWGSSLIYMPGMKNITRLLIERNPWDYFDIGVPYPTGFHPRTDSDVIQWQEYVRTRSRKTLFSFAGATRGAIKNDFRGLLLGQCRNESGACRVVDCGGNRCANGSSAILQTFLDSDFCLQPRGDSFTRRSIFDCMVAGSIPVFFWHRTAYYQYEWFLPGEPESYSVFIDRKDVINGTSIRRVLERYSREEVTRMREKVIDYIPKFVYAEPKEGLGTIKDAFDVALDGVLRRFREHRKMEGWKGNIRKLK